MSTGGGGGASGEAAGGSGGSTPARGGSAGIGGRTGSGRLGARPVGNVRQPRVRRAGRREPNEGGKRRGTGSADPRTSDTDN
jgi:hypothetical protein